MKRKRGFDHIMKKKTIKRAAADIGFIFIVYNLKRIMNIIGLEKLIEIMTRFSIVFNLKRTTYKLLKSKNILAYTYFPSNPKYCYYYIKFEIQKIKCQFLDKLTFASIKSTF